MDELFAVKHDWLIPLLPLIGAMVSGFFGARWLKGQSHWPIWLGVGASAMLSISLLFGMLGLSHQQPEQTGVRLPAGRGAHEPTLSKATTWFDWIVAGGTDTSQVPPAPQPDGSVGAASVQSSPATFYVQAGAWIDPLTVVMLCVVTGIGFFITVFAAGYMKGEEGYFRFFAYLGLFLFSMTCLVMGNNFVMLYLGWEGVGLCSYLLVGYYYDRPSAREAAKKAFLVNRVGDFGFSLGIMLIFLAFGTVSYFGNGVGTHTGVLELATGSLTAFQAGALKTIPFLLMLGAFGKSAQFPLYVWLPDAMEGPTPVSALIHAATMVTAGVYMIARCGSLFFGNQAAMITVACVGAFTALFAATIAMRQFDLKKIFAYSTISQLGFMFVGVGVLAPVAGIFHLMTHAFFKALLFLSSGVVMHAMSGELDMRKMSGLKRVLPKTRWLMLIGCAALAGFPFLSGFFSKDEIVGYAWDANKFLGLVMLFTAFLTAYYTFRLYFRVFEGPTLVPEALAHGAHGAHAAADDHGHASADQDHGAGADAHGPDSHADAHATASAAAVQTGDTAESGVDRAAAQQPPAHAAADDAAHGHGDHAHDHEPAIMILPLVVLAIGALIAGYLNWPEREHTIGTFLGRSPSFQLGLTMAQRAYYSISAAAMGAHENPDVAAAAAIATGSSHNLLMVLSGLIAIFGIYCAYLMHLKDRGAGERLAQRFPGITRVLEAKYWVDEIYQAGIVEPLRTLGKVLSIIDQLLIDGIIWLISVVPQTGGFALKRTTQRGYLQGYAVTMLFGIAVILILMFSY